MSFVDHEKGHLQSSERVAKLAHFEDITVGFLELLAFLVQIFAHLVVGVGDAIGELKLIVFIWRRQRER